MRRDVSLEEISDGKLYRIHDLVMADCEDCTGCSACCHNMGDSVLLDPYDVWLMTNGIKISFQNLLSKWVELNVHEGIILPNLCMKSEDEACFFLNEEGRCGIHSYRPGICRLFPLGRYYTEGEYSYFLQIHECRKTDRKQVTVEQWLDTPSLHKKRKFVQVWHDFLQESAKQANDMSDERLKQWNLMFLNTFYLTPYTEQDFYTQFYQRLSLMEGI